MLKKMGAVFCGDIELKAGMPVYIVTRKGEILEGYHIRSTLVDLVTLNCSPIDGSEDAQGFSIEGDILKPNWCSGKKHLLAACLTKEKALAMAKDKLRTLSVVEFQ